MTIPTGQEFTDAYHRAPQYVQDFIDGDELGDTFHSIRTTYKIHLDNAGTFADLLNAVILELIPLGQFEAALAEHIPSIDQDTRTKITREVNEKVFAVLRTRAVAPLPSPKATEGTASAPVQVAGPSVAPPISVVAQKLSAPITEAPKEVTVAMPTAATKPAENPRYSGGSDPYREPVE